MVRRRDNCSRETEVLGRSYFILSELMDFKTKWQQEDKLSRQVGSEG